MFQVNREQYPLAVAEAMTIHKSQGSTMNFVTVQLGNRALERSLLYVACSRAKTISGLFLVGKFTPPSPPNQFHTPTLEMKRLREVALLVPRFRHLRSFETNIFQIVSHNVQSIAAHLPVIRSDYIFRASHCFAMQETWAKEGEIYDLSPKQEIVRSSIQRSPSGTGSMIYAESDYNVVASSQYDFSHLHIFVSCCKYQGLFIVNIYKSPRASLTIFKECLEQIDLLYTQDDILCFGDFNEKIDVGSEIVKYMNQQFGMDLLSPIKATTDAGTCIDAVFGRLINFQSNVFVYESFSSYHKPLIIQITCNNQ